YYEDGTIGTRDTTSNIVIGASNSTNQNYYTVTLAKGFENGYVSGATVYGDTYLEGTNVSVQGIADNGYMLEYWVVYNVDETSVLTVNPYEFEVDKDVTLIPVFVSIPPKYSVTVTNGISNIASAEEGATVTVTSNAPQAGYEFDQWTGSGVTFANEESPITTFVMPAQAVTITATYKYSTLTGSVTINGAFKYGQTLTASVSATNNTGTLSYKWQRNDVDIAGATANTYTITADDIGTILKVVVTSDHQTGNINAATTAVLKADGGASPTGITKTDCTASENGTISGVTTAMEYKLSTATDWTPCTDSTIENLEAGTYLVRVKETATTNASEAANVAIAAYIAPEIEPAPEPETPTTEPETPAPETETTEQPQKQNLPTWVILVIVLLAAGSLGLIFLLLKAQKRKTRRKKKTTTAKPKTQTKAEVKTEIKPQAKPEVKTQTRNKKGL
ncbi:MAG: hypothetical protein J5689_03085, partial [Clostridia bacterium]|nr:hypothetical protein [Clostridia bacterium]